ncbi:MAG: diheme cytochrome c [Sulfurimonas sp.]
MKKTVIATLLIAGSLIADGSGKANDVAPVMDSFYKAECASCHFAYQPGLLPSKSWEKVMGNLNNHFGTDASLEAVENQKILKYLTDNSAEKYMQFKRSQRINDSIAKGETPIAITETRYFIKKHREITPKFIKQKEVKSLANCMACHTTADKGSYSERDILIPNFGKWEDD